MSTSVSNIVAASATNFGSVDPKLASMSFVELDSTITEGLTSAKSKLVNLEPYLLEMRERLSAQGRRTDLPDTPKGLTWQKWVEQKKNLLGSLSTVKRLLRGDRKKKRTEKTPELTHLESKLLGTVSAGHDLVKAIQQGGNVDAAVKDFLDCAPDPQRIEEYIERPVKAIPAPMVCKLAANLVSEIEADFARPSAPQMTKRLRSAVDKLKDVLERTESAEAVVH
jgi:hypothetical protein